MSLRPAMGWGTGIIYESLERGRSSDSDNDGIGSHCLA